MNEPFLDKLQRRLAPVVSLFDRIGFAWFWLLVSILLLALVLILNPAKLGAYLWFMSKISGAFAAGYAFDWAAFRGADPRHMSEGIEKTMAQTRRATLIAAAIVGAGLIG